MAFQPANCCETSRDGDSSESYFFEPTGSVPLSNADLRLAEVGPECGAIAPTRILSERVDDHLPINLSTSTRQYHLVWLHRFLGRCRSISLALLLLSCCPAALKGEMKRECNSMQKKQCQAVTVSIRLVYVAGVSAFVGAFKDPQSWQHEADSISIDVVAFLLRSFYFL